MSRAKKMLRKAGGQSLAEALDTASVQQGFAHQTRDHREAVAAFLEKREPRFTGE